MRSETARDGYAPVVRLTRRLYLLGTPVADVVEEIPLPEPVAGRSPPAWP